MRFPTKKYGIVHSFWELLSIEEWPWVWSPYFVKILSVVKPGLQLYRDGGELIINKSYYISVLLSQFSSLQAGKRFLG